MFSVNKASLSIPFHYRLLMSWNSSHYALLNDGFPCYRSNKSLCNDHIVFTTFHRKFIYMIYAHMRNKVPTKPFFANFLCEKKLIEKKSLQFFHFYPCWYPQTPNQCHRFFFMNSPWLNIKTFQCNSPTCVASGSDQVNPD